MPLSRLTSAVMAPATPEELVPPPRFTDKRFATYRIDGAIPGQAAAVERVRRFARHQPSILARILGRSGKAGLYLDGGFGVGKTHLLAACFHEASGSRRYLSFSEAMSLMALVRPARAIELLSCDLVCIDEFELDDPTNTRLADLLVGGLIDRGARIVTTSNTVPGELGQGRMAVDLFRAQLGRIEAAFEDVHVPGGDYRRRSVAGGQPRYWGAAVEADPGDGKVVADAAHLDRWLSDIPVVNLRRLAAKLAGLSIIGLTPFTNQLAALRFVHLVDRLYDYNVPLRIRSAVSIVDLFPPEHCQAAFHKKYRRCESRLLELCA